MIKNPYEVLGVKSNSTFKTIKAAYRDLVKKHHPDAGGDEQKILALNAAWEILGDEENRQAFDLAKKVDDSLRKETRIRDLRNSQASKFVKSVQNKVVIEENELALWLKIIYAPIDKSIGQVINALPSKLRELSADPYDDYLMESFCEYLEKSQLTIKKASQKYQSLATPNAAKKLSLSLYHCFSQVQDGLNELDLYTKGYVDHYLHDGNEMFREAKRKRVHMKEERRNLPIS